MDPDLGRFATIWAAAGTANAVFPVHARRRCACWPTPWWRRSPTRQRAIAPPATTPIQPPTPTRPRTGRVAKRRVTREVERLSVQYPGGLAARYRWAGSGRADDVFGISEATGTLTDFGPLVGAEPGPQCRAELRVEGPLGCWTARFASPIFDAPRGRPRGTRHGLLVVRYGFVAVRARGTDGRAALVARERHADGRRSWPRRDWTTCILQTELETIALRPDGTVAWRAAHSDVITEAQLVAGRAGPDHLLRRARVPRRARPARLRECPHAQRMWTDGGQFCADLREIGGQRR